MGVVELSVKGTGIFTGLLFGVKDPDLAQVHARWGTSHLLAVSGFHVALVVGIVFRALRRTRWKVQYHYSCYSFIWPLRIRCQCHACRHNGGLYSHGKVDRASNEGHSGGEPGSCMLASVEALVCMGRRLEIIGAFGLGHRLY